MQLRRVSPSHVWQTRLLALFQGKKRRNTSTCNDRTMIMRGSIEFSRYSRNANSELRPMRLISSSLLGTSANCSVRNALLESFHQYPCDGAHHMRYSVEFPDLKDNASCRHQLAKVDHEVLQHMNYPVIHTCEPARYSPQYSVDQRGVTHPLSNRQAKASHLPGAHGEG